MTQDNSLIFILTVHNIVIGALLALGLTYLGYYMAFKLKQPSSYIGIRNKITRSSPEAWCKINRAAGIAMLYTAPVAFVASTLILMLFTACPLNLRAMLALLITIIIVFPAMMIQAHRATKSVKRTMAEQGKSV